MPAMGYMMMAVIGYSAFPVLSALGEAGTAPFLFTGAKHLCAALSMFLVVLLVRGRFLTSPSVRSGIISHSTRWPMLAVIGGYVGFAAFALSLGFVDAAVATIFYESSTLFLIMFMAFLFRGSGRYRPNMARLMVFLLPGLAGCALVVISGEGAVHMPVSDAGSLRWHHLAAGASLALLAGVAASVSSALTMRMGVSIAAGGDGMRQGYETRKGAGTRNGGMDEVAVAVFLTSMCFVVAGVVSICIGLVLSETLSMRQFGFAAVIGGTANSVAVMGFRVANLKTDNLGVNGLGFATPLVALLWIWMFVGINVARVDFLVVGAVGIVLANLLVAFDRRGAKRGAAR